MPLRIEDYAMIGDCRSGALVGTDGSIDWLCLPRFDSDAFFCALLGGPEHGRWALTPDLEYRSQRHYRDGGLVLETHFITADAELRIIDFMPMRDDQVSCVVRLVEGISGRMRLRHELCARFDYGLTIPWIRARDDERTALIAGPHQLVLRAPAHTLAEHLDGAQRFDVCAGERLVFVLQHCPAHAQAPDDFDAYAALDHTEAFWHDWSSHCRPAGEWSDQVLRSAITLKGLSFTPTGGIAAALTTSLPETLGGHRNWDYRYCWIRDASFTLSALRQAGYVEEAVAWRGWVRRAVAGAPHQLQVMYGLAGERRLDEWIADWLPGYEGAHPVRIGNAAAQQFQLDIWGELVGAFDTDDPKGLEMIPQTQHEIVAFMDYLETLWRAPDDGIWEIRAERRHFVHSKVMAWLAFDRISRAPLPRSLLGHQRRWQRIADRIHADVCANGLDAEGRYFVQSYGHEEMDAALLLLPLSGFLPADDPRMVATVHKVAERLMEDGLLQRYDTGEGVDGLSGEEGTFLACSFWLVECYALIGELELARGLMRRLVGLLNDVGLLAEEYDTRHQRQVGNFPQAYSHVALINAAFRLHSAETPG
ncbi:glycoside hydrolase family 15 protein [Halotalea alkalilenta]|uniref:glycoside hydrolase family 15 protein n=1 Tax=Halotalea alkalilenta TaxID=376489 RepID=UPI00048485BC|nr:glycoside hydrolase family 15 protein [Halotalea alkalilenta]